MAFTAFALWVALSVGIEYIIEILKQAFPFLNTQINGIDNERVLALALGLLVCFGGNIDFFVMLGVVYEIPFVGYIFSAIFIAGGSGKLHDFIKAITAIGDKYRSTSTN